MPHLWRCRVQLVAIVLRGCGTGQSFRRNHGVARDRSPTCVLALGRPRTVEACRDSNRQRSYRSGPGTYNNSSVSFHNPRSG